jgi:hypothetical protein
MILDLIEQVEESPMYWLPQLALIVGLVASLAAAVFLGLAWLGSHGREEALDGPDSEDPENIPTS